MADVVLPEVPDLDNGNNGDNGNGDNGNGDNK